MVEAGRSRAWEGGEQCVGLSMGRWGTVRGVERGKVGNGAWGWWPCDKIAFLPCVVRQSKGSFSSYEMSLLLTD